MICRNGIDSVELVFEENSELYSSILLMMSE